ncbi:MAG TPA: sensor domain-containing diguanylate cyclase [Solirubrobacteraceae bacterium]|nr:sensor domain-containing diguanylate cyclase [Solirubrobacteraceae bacterium]
MNDPRRLERPRVRGRHRARALGALRQEERHLAGRVGAVLWVIASLSVIAMALALPGRGEHRTATLLLGAAGFLWGTLSGLALDYRRLPVWTIHASALAATAATAVAMGLTGGAASPAWACLFYVVIFAAYFFTPAAAAFYLVACVAVESVAVATAGELDGAAALARLAVAVPAFVVLGGAIVLGKRFTWGLRLRSQSLAAEQGALRRIATAVVDGVAAERFYELVALEVAGVLGASGAGILRREADGQLTLVGIWARDARRMVPVGSRFAVQAGTALERALAGGPGALVADHAPDTVLGALGYRSAAMAPLLVGGRTWGLLAAVEEGAGALTEADERRLSRLAQLIAAGVASIEQRAELARQAATDALTGLWNRRVLHERLAADLARARRTGAPVAVAIVDVDRFKRVNDHSGHEAGDRVLVAVARALATVARAQDTVARVGGDEFAWILPDTSAPQAQAAVRRARDEIERAIGPGAGVTVSVGVADSRPSADPAQLLRAADRALYAAKRSGRDRVCVQAAPGLA